MKFTNVKQLIIKFMGGGIINFPTRFLRWVKINGDVDGSDDGGGSSGGEGINNFYIKLNRENLHLNDFNYTDFDTTIGHDLDFFFEDTDINLIEKIIDNIKEQIDNIYEKTYTPPNYNSLFSYISHETGFVGDQGDGVYPVFNIEYDNNEEHIFIHITNTDYAGVADFNLDLIFVQKLDGKFYYPEQVG